MESAGRMTDRVCGSQRQRPGRQVISNPVRVANRHRARRSGAARARRRRPTPTGTFPPPALRTRRADLRHRALQWNEARLGRCRPPPARATSSARQALEGAWQGGARTSRRCGLGAPAAACLSIGPLLRRGPGSDKPGICQPGQPRSDGVLPVNPAAAQAARTGGQGPPARTFAVRRGASRRGAGGGTPGCPPTTTLSSGTAARQRCRGTTRATPRRSRRRPRAL